MDYKKQLSAMQLEKLKTVLDDMPSYCRDYFDYCDGTLNRSAATMLEYAYDIRTYFRFIASNNPMVSSVEDVTLDILDKMTPRDIQEYMSYLRSHKDENGRIITNDANARARKLSSLRSFYQYYFAFGGLHSNPAKLVNSPRIHNKKQSRLDSYEMKELLTDVITGDALDDNKKPYARRSNMRDTAIIALLGGTGIRVSELVGIDLNDIDWEHNCIRIIRKGGNEDIVYFGDELHRYLEDYINYEREPGDDKEKALFVASRKDKGRLTVRSVERIVSKYGTATIPSKHLSPHSLRRTFGTNYYEETSDLYAVADALGHKNIQVTKDHYADISERKKQQVKEFSDKLLK